MDINQTKQTEIGILTGPKYSYKPDRTDQNMVLNQSEQIEIKVFARPNRPNFVFCPDRTDRNMDINQTKQKKKGTGYQSEPTDQNTGITQTKQAEAWALSRSNKMK